MRWRDTFMTEVSRMLQQLGLRTCPVCGSAESLETSRFPVILVDGRFPAAEAEPPDEQHDDDLTFAVRIECLTCGHLMLFNAQRYRTGDEKILTGDLAEDERWLADQDPL